MSRYFNKLKCLKYKNIIQNIDVLLIHECDEDLIEKYILNPINAKYYTFCPEKELIINIKIVMIMVANLYSGYTLRSLYIRSLLYYIKPKITLTFIDDSIIAFEFAKIKGNIKHFAIQNGKRKRSQLESIHPEYGENQEKIYLDNFFCFGEYEEYMYKKYNHHVNNYLPVGSFRNSVNECLYEKNEKYDICLVSCWKPINFIKEEEKIKLNKYVTKINTIIDEYLIRFLKENSCRAIIALNGDENGLDAKYYRKKYPIQVDLSPRKELSSYKASQCSTVTISPFSTILVEAFGNGQKVMFIDYSEKKLYSSYEDGIWLLTYPDYKAFSDRLKKILNMDIQEWYDKTKNYSTFLMKYDNKTPTYVKIQNELSKQISRI